MAIGKRLAQVVAALGALAVVASPALAASPAANLFYQRALMSAADGACRLFAPDVATALGAAKAQARGAALRSGADPAYLMQIEAQAGAAVAAAGCGSAAIVADAQRVRGAFAGFAALDHMDFPGDFAAWRAERPDPSDEARWRASQRDRFGWDLMQFGLAAKGANQAVTAVARFADGAQPYGARLVMRDAAATSGPYLDARQADIDGRLPIDARLPPRAATRVFQAGEMQAAGKALTAQDMKGALAFAFPTAATDALASLDPRETVAVEFLFAGDGGEVVRTAYVEVGDFAAARAFQSIPRRY
jgi:hypothetical protein